MDIVHYDNYYEMLVAALCNVHKLRYTQTKQFRGCIFSNLGISGLYSQQYTHMLLTTAGGAGITAMILVTWATNMYNLFP